MVLIRDTIVYLSHRDSIFFFAAIVSGRVARTRGSHFLRLRAEQKAQNLPRKVKAAVIENSSRKCIC